MASASILNTGKAMYAWNGTNWLPLNAQNNLLNSTRWSKVATGGETSISGYDDNGLNLSYSPGYEQLFLNGILLVRNIDYTATNGTSIDGLTAISAGSNIDIISFQSISLANVYTQEQSDTRYMSSSTVFLENWSEDEEGNLLPSEDSTYSIGSEDYKVKDLYLSASSLYLEDPSNPGQTIALSVDSEGSLKVGESKLITEANANNTLDTSFLLTSANASATYLSQSSASTTYLTQTSAINLYIPKTDNDKVYNKISSFQHYNTGYGTSARTTSTSTSWYALNIGGTGLTGTRAYENNNILTFNKQFSGSHLLIHVAFPVYITPGGSGVGLRCQISTDGSNYNLVDILTEGPANGWGAAGYGGSTAAIINFQWYTKDNSSISSNILNKTGEVRLFFQGRSWNSADTAFWIDYDNSYPKFGSINIYEVME